MHIIVVGCGRVGSELATILEANDHSVAVIDKVEASFRRLPASYAGIRVVGMGFDADTLAEAGVEKAGALAAVTNGDNSNILIARVARESFGIERVCARIYDPARAEIYQRLGIPTVATVSWTTDQVLRRLLPDEQNHEWIDAGGAVVLSERSLPKGWAGRPVTDLTEPGRFAVAAVTRLGVARVATPELIAQDGDILHFMVDISAMDALTERLSDTSATSSRGH